MDRSGCRNGWTGAWAVLLFLAILTSFPLAGQVGRSGLTGTVTDPTGAAVAGAKISVRNESTNLATATVTTDNGNYFVPGLPVGSYSVTAQAQGFETLVTEHVETEVDKVSTVDVKLQLGTASQSINVEATVSLLNAVSGTEGHLVTNREIEDLPLNGRSWVTLNLLTPGAASFHGISMSFSNITESVAPGNFIVNGLRGGNNLYFIDGVNLLNVEDQILSILPPLESLQEFRTQTSNPTAEFVGGAGAMVTAVTKSGGNAIHGAAWEYLRNSALDARNFFDAQVPPLRRNQFGGDAGGPIRKDRIFWFGSWESFRQRKAQTFVGDYPTTAQRAGDLSSLSQAVRDPLAGSPFPGNIVPASRINTLNSHWLDGFIPLPNTSVPLGQGNYRREASRPVDFDTVVGRVDSRIGSRGHVFGRYFYTRTTSDQPTILQSFSRTQERLGHNLAIQYTETLTPRLLLEGRFGYHVYDDREPEGNAGNLDMLKELGVQNDPNFTHEQDSKLAPPQMSVTGLSQFGTSFLGRPRRIYNRSFYYDGSAFLTTGVHAIKLGGNLTNNRANFPEIIIPTGTWTYDGFFSGLGFGDYLLGYPRTVSARPDKFDPFSRRWTGGLWFQDDWKLSQRLTVNLGLRMDIDTRYYSANNSVANFDLAKPPVAVNITPGNRPDGWTRALVDGPQYLWAPRFGFAYKLHGDSTVVRGGYGLYWQPMTADPFVNYSINPPFIRSLNATYDFTDLPSFDRTLPLRASAASATGATAIQKEFKDGYVQQWNLTLEHTIGGTLLALGYVGNKGTDLYRSINVNLAPPGPGPINPRRPFTSMVVAQGGFVPPGPTAVAGISVQGFGGNSSYNAMHVKVQRRFTHNLAFTVSYAWGKVIDDNSGSGVEGWTQTQQQPLYSKAERGLANIDYRHSLTFNYIYSLPFGKGQRFLNNGIAAKIAGGWQVEGITMLQSGSPFTVLNAYDNLNNGGTGYPDLICNPNYGSGRSSGQKTAGFFNTACFAAPGGGQIGVPNYKFGNEGRDSVIGPGTNVWNVGLLKSTPIKERMKLEFRTEWFNLMNHPNFSVLPESVFQGTPTLSFGTPQFGKIFFTSQDAREIQFGVKFSF